jgi:surface protein
LDIPGFFCAIPFPDDFKKLPVLILYNNNFINEEENDVLELNLDNDKLIKKIKLDKSRKIYNDQKYNIMIIEIKKSDGFDVDSFLNLDKGLFSKKFYDIYNKESIYILYYANKEKEDHSLGTIFTVSENYKITHKCKLKEDSIGYPLIKSKNKNLIGINLEKAQNKSGSNIGKLLAEPIINFNKKYNQNIDINNISDEIETNKNNNEIRIYYDFNKEKKFLRFIVESPDGQLDEDINLYKIFGQNFVNNNKNICKMIINDEEYELTSILPEKFRGYKGDSFEIKLKGINDVIDLSYIFAGCESLKQLPDFDKIDTSRMERMRGLFAFCFSLLYLPDIGNWNIKNVKDISYMFCSCTSLLEIPKIGKWNTKQITNMEFLFGGCRNLIQLPDISRWITDNVKDMKGLFYECYSITSLPDISNWNTENVTNMTMMFFGDRHLTSLPDISKWNTKNVTSLALMFGYCVGITSYPDFTKWNIEKVEKPYQVMFMNIRNNVIPPDFWKSFG